MLQSSTISSSKAFSLLLWLTLIAWIFLLFLQQTNLSAGDLGRHLMNGSIIVNTGKVFQTNLYSYTNASFLAPNHHWLFGVLVFGLQKVGGFSLITAVIALVYWTGIMSIVMLSKRITSGWIALVAAFSLLPLMAMRTESRPEAFSVLGLSLTIIICYWFWNKNKLFDRIVAATVLFMVMAFWVNLHILFIMGFMVTGLYFLTSFINESWLKSLKYLYLIFIQLIASLLNPLGWNIIIYPFTILRDYQYPIAENKSVYFFLRHFLSLKSVFLAILLLVMSCLVIISFKKVSTRLKPIWMITGILIIATALMNRFSGFLQLPALLVVAIVIDQRFGSLLKIENVNKISKVILVACISLSLFFAIKFANPFRGFFGLGITPYSEAAATFFKTNNLPGPIFNDYDIGGYLIYSLYPSKSVFVDNRPEAYPGSFFTEEYIPAQKDEAVWHALEEKYHFNTIFFYRHDASEGAMPFMIKRIKDLSWAPVYVDDYSLILLKRTDSNQQLIEKLELPPSYYSIQKN